MKILHISLGLPPFRTGGLNRYCSDLMEQQAADGEEVGLLYPGEFSLGGKTKIRKTKHARFSLYRVVNPLPVALTAGVSDPARYRRPCRNPEVYREFLRRFAPDVIHVHSVQGIHREFFEAAKDLGIRTVYTTHDYYLLCSRCVLMKRDGSLCAGEAGAVCAACNAGFGFSRKQEIVMQSRLYEKLKYSRFVSSLRRGQRKKLTDGGSVGTAEAAPVPQVTAGNGAFDALRDYYAGIFRLFDTVHCNSDGTREVYRAFFPDADFRTVGITHAGIRPAAHEKDPTTLRIGFVGGMVAYKGLSVLLRAVGLLRERGVDFRLYLYGADYSAVIREVDGAINGGFYTKENEEDVWNSFDVLVIPSLCRETFGFAAVEALAHGVRVVCSDLVGASCLLRPSSVYRHDSPEELAARLCDDWAPEPLPEYLLSMPAHSRAVRENIYR